MARLTFQFRDAKKEDFNTIALFPQNEQELFYMYPKGKYPIMADELADVAAGRILPTVITDDGEVVGYCNLYDVIAGEFCWIGNLIVSPESRGTGAADFLVQTIIRRAAEEYKVNHINLICHNTNIAALLFYYRLGFKPYDMKIMIDYKQQRIVGIKMQKEL